MHDDRALLSFTDYRAQGEAIAGCLAIPYYEATAHYFPDGEVSITLPAALPPQVIFCRSLNQPNNKLIELLLACKTARALGATDIMLIAPYLCYMRQDIAFHPGESVSQRIIGGFLEDLVDTLIAVDPHLHRIARLSEVMPNANTLCLSAAALIGEFIAQHFKDALLVGPDEESVQWVSCASEKAGFPYVIAHKTRNGDRDVMIELPDDDFAGRDIILLDDIISSGHTISQTAQALKNAGAGKIHAIVTHALFDRHVEELLHRSGIEQIWSTDSITHDTNAIALSGLIARAISRATK